MPTHVRLGVRPEKTFSDIAQRLRRRKKSARSFVGIFYSENLAYNYCICPVRAVAIACHCSKWLFVCFIDFMISILLKWLWPPMVGIFHWKCWLNTLYIKQTGQRAEDQQLQGQVIMLLLAQGHGSKEKGSLATVFSEEEAFLTWTEIKDLKTKNSSCCFQIDPSSALLFSSCLEDCKPPGKAKGFMLI